MEITILQSDFGKPGIFKIREENLPSFQTVLLL